MRSTDAGYRYRCISLSLSRARARAKEREREREREQDACALAFNLAYDRHIVVLFSRRRDNGGIFGVSLSSFPNPRAIQLETHRKTKISIGALVKPAGRARRRDVIIRQSLIDLPARESANLVIGEFAIDRDRSDLDGWCFNFHRIPRTASRFDARSSSPKDPRESPWKAEMYTRELGTPYRLS